jgi:hypothetical protein
VNLDLELLQRFEAGFNPRDIEASAIPAQLLGYGEISAIFKIEGNADVACKCMPLFDSFAAAETYSSLYAEYCGLLERAGLAALDTGTAIVDIPGRPVVLYIGQRAFPPGRIAHRLLHTLDPEQVPMLIRRIVSTQAGIWEFNRNCPPGLEIVMDGQISNWVLEGDVHGGTIYYIDTSTPFVRKQGEHQIDPELLLRAAPPALRWVLRRLFVDEVMARYYDVRKNMTDFAANLYKKQRPDLIPMATDIINSLLPADVPPLTRADIDRYYREDRFIWSLFLAMRRMDRFITTKILRRRYEFVLPGRIRR